MNDFSIGQEVEYNIVDAPSEHWSMMRDLTTLVGGLEHTINQLIVATAATKPRVYMLKGAPQARLPYNLLQFAGLFVLVARLGCSCVVLMLFCGALVSL